MCRMCSRSLQTILQASDGCVSCKKSYWVFVGNSGILSIYIYIPIFPTNLQKFLLEFLGQSPQGRRWVDTG